MRNKRTGIMRLLAWMATVPTAVVPILCVPAQAQLLKATRKSNEQTKKCELPAGRTDKLTMSQWQTADAKRRAAEEAAQPEVRLLSAKEMSAFSGRGPYRVKYLAGTKPWHRSFRDANLCNGNLFKSFSDIEVAPGRSGSLAMQRSYNSQDDRIGPFGQGWTHTYDIRTEEENPDTNYSDASLNIMDRTDFFGGKYKYHRDADGLYSPPAYLYDETDAEYDTFVVNGPIKPLADIVHGMDGTVKHFVTFAGSRERVCDYIKDRYGNTTNLTYTQTTVGTQTVNLLQSVTDPSGRQILYTWQNLGTATQPAWRITQAAGPKYTVVYSYNADCNLSGVTLDPGDTTLGHANQTTQFEYTSYSGATGTESGLLSKVTDTIGHAVSYTYTLSPISGTAWVNTITEPGNGSDNVFTIATSVSFGSIPFSVIVSSPAFSGIVVQGSIDTQLRKAFMSLGYAYLYQNTYDSANNVIFRHNAPSAFLPGQYISQINGTGSFMTYGPHGNVLTETPTLTPYYVPTLPHTTTTYGNASQYFQKQSVTDLSGHTSTFVIGTNQGVDPSGITATCNGNKGSVLCVRDAGYTQSTSSNYQKQYAYRYNDFGQKIQETNPNGVVTTYSYDDQWGNMTTAVQDPHVTTGDNHLARTTSIVYDVDGHTLSSTDPKGQVFTFTYNSLGQVKSASFPATATTPAEIVAYAYDAKGRPTGITDLRGTLSFAYEPDNDRISSVTDPVTGIISYTYGAAGERATVTLPGGGTWTYSYGSLKMMTSDDPNTVGKMPARITDDQGRAVDYWLDESGRPYQVRTDQVFDTGMNLVSYMQTAYTYDNSTIYNPSAWLTSLTNTWNTKNAQGQWQQSLLTQNNYTYNDGGQRLTNQIVSSGANRTENYSYDELNRLKTVDYGDGQTQAYSFDAMGNRLSKQDSAIGTESYSYNAANMLLTRGTGSYTNDANGNTLTGGGRTNSWDSQNRLVQCVNGANTSSFVYGPDGIRRQSTLNGNSIDYVVDSSMCLRERNHATGSNIATYLAGARGPEYRRDDVSGEVRWYAYDGLGSVLAEIDPNGNITSGRKYDVYGIVRGGTNPGGSSSHKFVGQLGHVSEDNTGLIYMRARYMDPVTGRFACSDRAQDGANWFIYVNDNPVNAVDSTGLFVDLLMDAFDEFEANSKDAASKKTAMDWGRNKIEQCVAYYSGKMSAYLLAGGGDPAKYVFFSNNCGFGVKDLDAGVSVQFDLSQHRGPGSQHIDYSVPKGTAYDRWQSIEQEFIKGFIDGL